MKLVLCLDEEGGYCFNHRRQTRDKIQREHLIKYLKNEPLHMHPYSMNLWSKEDIEVIEGLGEGYYLCEIEDYRILASHFDEIILYHWHRTYPHEIIFDDSLLKKYQLVESETFKGSSHDNITFEVYQYEKE